MLGSRRRTAADEASSTPRRTGFGNQHCARRHLLFYVSDEAPRRPRGLQGQRPQSAVPERLEPAAPLGARGEPRTLPPPYRPCWWAPRVHQRGRVPPLRSSPPVGACSSRAARPGNDYLCPPGRGYRAPLGRARTACACCRPRGFCRTYVPSGGGGGRQPAAVAAGTAGGCALSRRRRVYTAVRALRYAARELFVSRSSGRGGWSAPTRAGSSSWRPSRYPARRLWRPPSSWSTRARRGHDRRAARPLAVKLGRSRARRCRRIVAWHPFPLGIAGARAVLCWP